MRDTKALTLADVKRIAAAAEAAAREQKWAVSIAVCDAGGHALWLQRMDGAPLMSAAVAPEKARTCVLRPDERAPGTACTLRSTSWPDARRRAASSGPRVSSRRVLPTPAAMESPSKRRRMPVKRRASWRCSG